MNLEVSNKDVKVLKATLMMRRNRDTLSEKEKAWVICDVCLKTLKDFLWKKNQTRSFKTQRTNLIPKGRCFRQVDFSLVQGSNF